MNHLYYSSVLEQKYKFLLLVQAISERDILREYIEAFNLNKDDFLVIDLHKTGKKTKTAEMKEYCKDILKVVSQYNPDYVICADADYYKILSGMKSAETSLGYVVQPVAPYTSIKNIIYVPSFKSIFYDPAPVRAKIGHSMQAMLDHIQDRYSEPGVDIIHSAIYPNTIESIKNNLQRLFDLDKDITCDIETFSLKHYDAGIGTIGFATNQNNGLAFEVDLWPEDQIPLVHAGESRIAIREMLRDFFIHFPRKIIFHNASFDVTVLIYQLFMDHIEDTAGLLYGLEVFMEKLEDTKLIAYLATNSCAGNTLGLKPLSHEFSGKYSVEEIDNIREIEIRKLLEYNVIDCLSTWYVYDKYYPIMIKDNQEQVYREVFRPALADIIQMQLTGMPIDPVKVQEAKQVLQRDQQNAFVSMMSLYVVQDFFNDLCEEWAVKKNQTLKKKRVTASDHPADLVFNPGSDNQLRTLIYDKLGFEITHTTDSGLGSTKGDVLKTLINKTEDQDVKNLLQWIIDYKDASIILSTFISAFEKAVPGPSGQHYLFGNFNLGGTVSGRLSSNGPNMQNIPATGSRYAKLIKKCFRITVSGWLFCGLDFASLEDRISALTTKDPNKLKVYTDGYDGHSLRAFFYFGEYMTGIDGNSVESINSIAKAYKTFRQDSKVPTFLLTYGGTYIGIMDKMGWPIEKARMIETRYHEMYAVSDQWVQAKLDEASKTGYVTVAFGLRVRTPLLKQVIRGTRVTPFEAEAEGRTAGNALGQSWGLLNTRAVTAFMRTVRASNDYRLNIRPCAQIHDANYYIIKDDPDLLLWMNKELVKEVEWQDHPDIWHDEVKLGGELSIFFPSWAEELSLPNDLDADKLASLTAEHLQYLDEEGIKYAA